MSSLYILCICHTMCSFFMFTHDVLMRLILSYMGFCYTSSNVNTLLYSRLANRLTSWCTVLICCTVSWSGNIMLSEVHYIPLVFHSVESEGVCRFNSWSGDLWCIPTQWSEKPNTLCLKVASDLTRWGQCGDFSILHNSMCDAIAERLITNYWSIKP